MLFGLSRQPVDRHAVTNEHAECLVELLWRGTRYIHRCVEQVAFIPGGGQRWTRTLQIRIPDVAASGPSWQVVPLGQYQRRRLPDFEVLDASGTRVNLLTRRQHGEALTNATLARHFYTLPHVKRRYIERNRVARDAYNKLRDELYKYFTTAGDISDVRVATLPVTICFARLLESVNVDPAIVGYVRVREFATDFVRDIETTRYLCWVEAEPGEVINLRVLYTTTDPLHHLGRGTMAERFQTFWVGLSEPRSTRRKVWADWYRQFGLSPLNYEFRIPGHRHTGSYYFTLDPPVHTDVTYLDWETDNSLQTKEIDCSTRSAHIHNDHANSQFSSNRGGMIRAYLHCSPRDHKLIVGTALLNCIFVILIAVGRVPGKFGSPGQSILLAAPSVYVAYLARQQQHYFADAMRRQRGIIWWYLGISVTFLVTITFSKHEGSLGSQGLGWFATFVSWLWGVSSAMVVAWYFPLGNSYERMTESLAKRKMNTVRRAEELRQSASQQGTSMIIQILRALPVVRAFVERKLRRRHEIVPPWKSYRRAIRQYSSQIAWSVTLAAIGMSVMLALVWKFPPKHKPPQSKPVVSQNLQATVSPSTTFESPDCQVCDISVRLARPTEPGRR
jgi:hypothetical protein